jgi:hypothetical protein
MVGATSASVCCMILASSSGVEAAAIEPAVSIKVRYSGECTIGAMSRLRSSMTAAGVPAGAQMPSQPARMKLIPASARVGTSGNTSNRSGLLTAMM